VTVSTNLGAWVNRRGLFAHEALADRFKIERIPSTFNWDFSSKGQHIELGMAEMNLFILLSALGLSHAINGERLIPIGTLYDPFIARGLDALMIRLPPGQKKQAFGPAVKKLRISLRMRERWKRQVERRPRADHAAEDTAGTGLGP
jgi:hypothetical protein